MAIPLTDTFLKPIVFTVVAVMVFGVAGAGCQSLPESRVVRLLPNTNQSVWRLSVNGLAETNSLTLDKLTNRLARLHLQHGDVVLFGKLPQFDSSQPGKSGDWLARYFDSSKVAMFVYPDSTSRDVFSVPIYHWVAPFENPRNLGKASFFREGKFLGAGMAGYENMVREIERTRVPGVFVLGSLYDINRGFGPFESPYENQEQLLNDALTKSDTQLLRPSQLPGL